MITKTVIEMSDDELDALVREKLGFTQYEFIPVQECGNNSGHQFKVDGRLSPHATQVLDRWANGEFVHYSNNAILNKLCADAHIPAGNYIITVCW